MEIQYGDLHTRVRKLVVITSLPPDIRAAMSLGRAGILTKGFSP